VVFWASFYTILKRPFCSADTSTTCSTTIGWSRDSLRRTYTWTNTKRRVVPLFYNFSKMCMITTTPTMLGIRRNCRVSPFSISYDSCLILSFFLLNYCEFPALELFVLPFRSQFTIMNILPNVTILDNLTSTICYLFPVSG
jgi:hypothetical protein